jgi:hypothetical protein
VHECENWSLKLIEFYSSCWGKESETNVDVPGGLRKLYNEERHNLYFILIIIVIIISRGMKCLGRVAHMERVKKHTNILSNSMNRTELFGRPSFKWEESIKMALKLMG